MPLDDAGYERERRYFRPEDVEFVYRLALLGAGQPQIADALGITLESFAQWRRRYPVLENALKEGGIKADAEMAHSFFHRAKGYEFKSEKIFCLRDGTVVRVPTVEHVPADPGAASKWLSARQPELWVQRVAVDVNVSVTDARERNLKLIEQVESRVAIEGPTASD
jgi:hypothetical protein